MFWEQNKRLIYGLLASLIILGVLGPSFSEGRPGIVRFIFKEPYDRAASTEKENAKKIEEYYNPRNQLAGSVIAEAGRFNTGLEDQYRSLRNFVIFIPPEPYRIASWEPEKQGKFLKIQAKSHRIDLIRYASLRMVEIADPSFGLDFSGMPPEEDKLPLLLRQAAMIDDLVRKAVDSGVERIDRITPMQPFETGPLNRDEFLKLYPVRMEISAPFDAIMKFANTFDGFHGTITEAGTESDPESGQRAIIVEIDIGSADGLTLQTDLYFTIFDETADEEVGLRYTGRAIVYDVPENFCRARSPAEPRRGLFTEDELKKREIVPGNLATTNFYTLMDLKILASPPKEKNSLTNRLTATITAGAVGLMSGSGPKGTIAGPRTPTKARRPPSVWRGGY